MQLDLLLGANNDMHVYLYIVAFCVAVVCARARARVGPERALCANLVRSKLKLLTLHDGG